jgi:hypothetical protein
MLGGPAFSGTDGYGTDRVKAVIKSKTSGEFATAELATALNNGRTGNAAPWEYIANAAYPTLKFERADYDPENDLPPPVTYDHITPAAGYGGTIILDEDTLTITANDGYKIDVIYIDGVPATAAQAVPTEGSEVHGAAGAAIDLSSRFDDVKSVVATFAYTVNFNSPAGGTLSVSRVNGDLKSEIESGSIVYGGEILSVTYEGPGSLALSGLRATSNAGEYMVTALRDTAGPAITVTDDSGGGDPGTDPITPIQPAPEDPIEDPVEDPVEDPIEDEPENPGFDIDDGNGEEPPAVVIPIDPDRDVKIDTDTGVETVTVPEGALTQEALDAAIEKANEAGTEPTVGIKIEKPADARTGEPVEINEVHVAISVSDLRNAAENEVNIRIDVFEGEGGEVTLNSDALRDLIDKADEDSETVVEVIIAKEDEAKLAELPLEQQKTLSDLNGDEGKVRVVYNISVAVGTSRIRNFETGGTLTLGLPYKLEPGEAGNRVLSYYIPEEGPADPMTDGRRYSDTRGLSIFETKHLSVYAVAYESEAQAVPPEPPEPEEDDPEKSGGGCDAGFGAFGAAGAVLLALGRILAVKRSKPQN